MGMVTAPGIGREWEEAIALIDEVCARDLCVFARLRQPADRQARWRGSERFVI